MVFYANKKPHRSSFSCLTNLPISQGVGLRSSQSSNGVRRHTSKEVKAWFWETESYPNIISVQFRKAIRKSMRVDFLCKEPVFRFVCRYHSTVALPITGGWCGWDACRGVAIARPMPSYLRYPSRSVVRWRCCWCHWCGHKPQCCTFLYNPNDW